MTQRTDRELLERAAKAACIDVNCISSDGVHSYDTEVVWNPLTDDGDALRMAVKLGRTDLSLLVGKLVLADECKGLTGVAVVRRAIVWDIAAAEIGEQQ